MNSGDYPVSVIHPEVERRLNALSSDLADNTRATKDNTDSIQRLEGSVGAIEKNTGDIVEFFNAGKGAFKFLGWLATVGKWVAYIAGAVTAVLGALHLLKTGVNPTDITPK
jgi:hypothetical protein